MGKKRKGEKLDLILSELQKLKSEVRALGKQHAGLAVQLDKLSSPKPAARPARKTVKPRAKPAGAAAARKSGAAPKRPVLVSPSDAAAG